MPKPKNVKCSVVGFANSEQTRGICPECGHRIFVCCFCGELNHVDPEWTEEDMFEESKRNGLAEETDSGLRACDDCYKKRLKSMQLFARRNES